MKFWDAEQLGRFLEHIEGDRLQAAWQVRAMTGMRRGEVLGVRSQDVGFDARRIAVRPTITAVGYEIKESTPKNCQPRTMDHDPGTVHQLRAHRERQAKEREVLGPGY